MRTSSERKHVTGRSCANNIVSVLLAATLSASAISVTGIAVATDVEVAYAQESTEIVGGSAQDSGATPLPTPQDPSDNQAPQNESQKPQTGTTTPAAPAPSDNAGAKDTSAATKAAGQGIINATVPLVSGEDPDPVEPSGSTAVPEEETMPPWTWPLTDQGYVAADGTIVQGAVRKGIDVSVHQGTIDWERVRAQGIDYAIIRCGYGNNITEQDDLQWERNVSECERLGIPYGVYLYSYAVNTENAASEAAHVLRLLEGHTPSLPVYIDLEESSMARVENRALMTEIASIFCNTIQEAGYKPGVYANLYWWNHILVDPVFNNWEKWVAQYNSTCNYAGTYKIWQASSKLLLDGIQSKYADVNFEFGGYFRDVDYASSLVTSGALDYVTQNGIMGAYGAVFDFAPSATLTRAQAVELLYNMSGRPAAAFEGVGNPQINNLPFADVALDVPYASAIKWARSVGVISESDVFEGNTFYPNEQITREQFFGLLANYAQTKGIEIKHNPINLILQADNFGLSDQYRDRVGWALDNGMFQSIYAEQGRAIQPSAPVNRALAANLLYSLQGIVGTQAQPLTPAQ